MIEENKIRELMFEGQPDLQLSATSIPPTSEFVHCLQMFGTYISQLDFDKPFKIVINYDPECQRTIFHLYDNRENKERRINWREAGYEAE